MGKIPELEKYLKVILPKNIDEKIMFLEKCVERIVLYNISSVKENYFKGLLYKNKEKRCFAVRYFEFDIKGCRINLDELNELFIVEGLPRKITKVPGLEMYKKTIFPEQKEEKIKKLRIDLNKIVFGNFNPALEKNYFNGLLFQKEKTENFVVKYSENNKYKNQEIDIDKLKELFVMINLTKV